MYTFYNFTPGSNHAINVAINTAEKLGHNCIGTEHLVLGLLDMESGPSYVLLTRKGITFEAYLVALRERLGTGVSLELTPKNFTTHMERTLEAALVFARMNGKRDAGTDEILKSVLRDASHCGADLLSALEVDLPELRQDVENYIRENAASNRALERNARPFAVPNGAGKRPPQSSHKSPMLEKYAKNLTAAARDGELDPVIGRETEVERVIQILSRRTKNNPCLIGEAGVGKTAIVEGLAQRIVDADVPFDLQDKQIYTLEMTSMVAGAKYRGDFEDRLKCVMDETAADPNIILFIDEVHTLVGAGAAEGAIDAANILKPHLARGKVRMIGATTIKEYRKHIEKDTALDRRFQCVQVEEPSQENTLGILRGLKPKYEQHHRIAISDEALEAAVSLSVRYLQNRFLPDKALDLVDEAASRLRLYRGQGEIYCELRRQHIEEVISYMTGIDVRALSQSECDALLGLEQQLHERVYGQESAVSAVAKAIRRGKVGLKDPQRPVGSFLFMGPTGVGKTELSCALAQTLYRDKDALVRIDMSEYMEKHSVAKLIGAPPGYVGHEDGGQLTERVRRKPYAVVLFDEIEKAHPDVWDILLQIMEDGKLTDSMGRSVSFKNTVVILTSNIGAQHMVQKKKHFGFGSEADSDHEVKEDVMAQLRETFRPELLNRVDDIIVFDRLTKQGVREIAVGMLDRLEQKARGLDINLAFSDRAIDQIAEMGYDETYGARPLRRTVQREMEDRLAEELLNGTIQAGQTVLCDFTDEFVFVIRENCAAAS